MLLRTLTRSKEQTEIWMKPSNFFWVKNTTTRNAIPIFFLFAWFVQKCKKSKHMVVVAHRYGIESFSFFILWLQFCGYRSFLCPMVDGSHGMGRNIYQICRRLQLKLFQFPSNGVAAGWKAGWMMVFGPGAICYLLRGMPEHDILKYCEAIISIFWFVTCIFVRAGCFCFFGLIFCRCVELKIEPFSKIVIGFDIRNHFECH